MKKIIISLTAIFIFLFNLKIKAQGCWNDYDFDFSDEFFTDTTSYHPFAEINYGYFNSYLKTFSGKINQNGFARLTLGYELLKNSDTSILLKFKRKAFFIDYSSTNILNKSNLPLPIRLNIDLWQAGLNWQNGYGYKFGSASLILSAGNALVWNRINLIEPDIRTFNPIPTDKSGIERFNQSIRFGTQNSAGIDFKISNHFNIKTNYTFGVIFPRYLFWKHMGSIMAELAGESLIENFVDEIKVFSPAAAPIMYFILKNGFSYAFYSLKKDKSFFPFKSENPLYYNSLNFGFSIVF